MSNKIVCANNGNVKMVAETISRNGHISKSQMSRKNFINKTVCILFLWFTCFVVIAQTDAQIRQSANTLNVPYEALKQFVESHRSLKIDMISVQGGTFSMGAIGIATPVHQVTLSSFSIGKYQVTQAQWVAVMGSNPSDMKHHPNLKGDNLPVIMVQWYDIVGSSGASMVINGITYYENGFIYKLNKLTGKKYRLPTEAEWEFAARGGNKSQKYQYSGSNTIGNVAWYNANSNSRLQPVGTKAPNELGIYDMSGNVQEWCSCCSVDYTKDAKTNPKGSSDFEWRVLRGGHYGNDAASCHVSYRNSNEAGGLGGGVGFRLAL